MFFFFFSEDQILLIHRMSGTNTRLLFNAFTVSTFGLFLNQTAIVIVCADGSKTKIYKFTHLRLHKLSVFCPSGVRVRLHEWLMKMMKLLLNGLVKEGETRLVFV